MVGRQVEALRPIVAIPLGVVVAVVAWWVAAAATKASDDIANSLSPGGSTVGPDIVVLVTGVVSVAIFSLLSTAAIAGAVVGLLSAVLWTSTDFVTLAAEVLSPEATSFAYTSAHSPVILLLVGAWVGIAAGRWIPWLRRGTVGEASAGTSPSTFIAVILGALLVVLAWWGVAIAAQAQTAALVLGESFVAPLVAFVAIGAVSTALLARSRMAATGACIVAVGFVLVGILLTGEGIGVIRMANGEGRPDGVWSLQISYLGNVVAASESPVLLILTGGWIGVGSLLARPDGGTASA